jgi:hypothetical protein
MIGTGLSGFVILYGLTFMCSTQPAQGSAAVSDGDLRSRMAGAWRSVPEKPQPKPKHPSQTDREDTSENPTFRSMRMEAVATRIAELDQVLNFDGDLCVMESEGRQMIFNIRYEGEIARRVDAFSGLALPGELTLVDGMIVLRIPSTDFIVKYRRLDEIPDSVRLDAYKVGSRQPDDNERASIQKEIARRMKQEQDVRFKAMEADKNSPTGFDETAALAMVAIDQENTNRLVELIQDVGWLSKARFGGETRLGAFLIVQHSGSIRLMRTVLPLFEEEAKKNPELGQSYALLYDRVQIILGRKQRYGSQALPNPDDTQTIGRLENRARVNEWRKKMGMEPLEVYAKELGKMSGVKVTIGE